MRIPLLLLAASCLISCSSIEPKPPQLLVAATVPVKVPLPVACLDPAHVPAPPDSRPPPAVINGDQRAQTAWIDSLLRHHLIYADKASALLHLCATDVSLAPTAAKEP